MTTQFVPHPDALSADLEKALVILRVDTNSYVVLSKTARAIWNALPATLDKIVVSVTTQFRGDPAVIRRDIETTLATLVERGIVNQASHP